MQLATPTTLAEALALAKAYDVVRRQTRKLLLDELRRRTEADRNSGQPRAFTEGEFRKLHAYTSDLTDARLLQIEDRTRDLTTCDRGFLFSPATV